MLVRLLGAFIGYKLLGFLGIFLGYFVASAIHRYVSYGAGAVNPLSAGQRQAVFLKTAFSLMGRLAKVDGQISQAEISHAEQLMAQLGMTPMHRQQAIEYFRTGAQADFAVEAQLQEFNAVCGHTHHLKQMLLVTLLGTALADGVFHAAEQQLLRQVALALGFSAAEFDQLVRMTQGQNHFAGGQPPSSSALDDAYAALGVSKEASDAELKKAYRKLMSQYHPDKLTGQGMPEDMIKMATERSQEVQAAYDLIKKSRGA